MRCNPIFNQKIEFWARKVGEEGSDFDPGAANIPENTVAFQT